MRTCERCQEANALAHVFHNAGAIDLCPRCSRVAFADHEVKEAIVQSEHSYALVREDEMSKTNRRCYLAAQAALADAIMTFVHKKI